jgi:hypothetical protein
MSGEKGYRQVVAWEEAGNVADFDGGLRAS